MFTLTQVLISVFLLSSVVLGSPITEDGIDDFGSSKGLEDRILGGAHAARGQFPYQVQLRFAFRGHPDPIPTWRTVCGGSILTNRFILTAALCFWNYGSVARNYQVAVGAHESGPNATDGAIHGVRRIRSHAGFDFNSTAHRNDVALLQTATVIQFTNRVRPIALHRGFIQNANSAIASGYGGSGGDHTILKFVRMSTFSNAECRRRFADFPEYQAKIHNWDTLCAFSGRGGRGICDYDMGGPLTLQNRLIGVSAWAMRGNGRCGRGVPDGFMRISTYLRWIENHINSGN